MCVCTHTHRHLHTTSAAEMDSVTDPDLHSAEHILWADAVLLVDAQIRFSAALDVRSLAELLAEDEGSGTGSLD